MRLVVRGHYRLLRWIYPAFRLTLPDLGIRSDDLARAMVGVVVQRTAEQNGVFENRDFEAIARALESQPG